MMHIGSFAIKALGLFAMGFVPQDKPNPAPAVPAKPAEIKPGTTVIIQDKTIDKPGEPRKVEGIRVEGKKLEIREVGGKPNDTQKPLEFRLQVQGEGKSENQVIVIKVDDDSVKPVTKTETRTVTVTQSGDAAKPGAKTDTRAYVVEGHPIHPPGTTKIIKLVIGEDGKVIRTETQEAKSQQMNQAIELRGVLKSVENAQPGIEEAIKKALESVKGEKLPVLGGANVEIRRIQIMGPNGNLAEAKPLILTPGVAAAATGTVTVTNSPEAGKLDAILNRLEKIEKALEELKAKK